MNQYTSFFGKCKSPTSILQKRGARNAEWEDNLRHPERFLHQKVNRDGMKDVLVVEGFLGRRGSMRMISCTARMRDVNASETIIEHGSHIRKKFQRRRARPSIIRKARRNEPWLKKQSELSILRINMHGYETQCAGSLKK